MTHEPQYGSKPMQAPVWLHLQNLKKLAKIVKEMALVLHVRALDGLCRCAGYSDYPDALRDPRPLSISFAEWRRGLAQEFGLADDELLPDSELLEWYSRIFVDRGWQAAQTRRGVRVSPGGCSYQDEIEETVPLSVNHEETVVDRIGLKKPCSSADFPLQDISFDERIPTSANHEATVVDRIRRRNAHD